MSRVSDLLNQSQKAAEQKAAEQKVAEQKVAEQKINVLQARSYASEPLKPISSDEQAGIDADLRVENASTSPDLSDNRLLNEKPKPQTRLKVSSKCEYVSVKQIPAQLIEMVKQAQPGRARLSNGDAITLAFLDWFCIDEKDARVLLKDRPAYVWKQFMSERENLSNTTAREQYHKRIYKKQNDLSFDIYELKVLLTYLLLDYNAELEHTDAGARLSFDTEGTRSVLLDGHLTHDAHNLLNLKHTKDGRPIY